MYVRVVVSPHRVAEPQQQQHKRKSGPEPVFVLLSVQVRMVSGPRGQHFVPLYAS